MKQKLLIIGASGHGKVVADIALKMGKWKQVAFLDDDANKKESMSLDVIGKLNDAVLYIDEYDFFVGIGNNDLRREIQYSLEKLGATIPVLIHPNTTIGAQVEIGAGTVVMAGAIVNCCTVIGKGCIINTGSSIDHDNTIGNYVHISPGVRLAGTVKVGQGAWLGIGSIVSNNLSICSASILGAGAVVVKDINEPGVYIGVPVRRVKIGKNSNISK